eukprot:1486481-Rhodomonas_salina.2
MILRSSFPQSVTDKGFAITISSGSRGPAVSYEMLGTDYEMLGTAYEMLGTDMGSAASRGVNGAEEAMGQLETAAPLGPKCKQPSDAHSIRVETGITRRPTYQSSRRRSHAEGNGVESHHGARRVVSYPVCILRCYNKPGTACYNIMRSA